MLGYLTLAGWLVTITLGLRMHGVRRFPIGVVLPHAVLAFGGLVLWLAYLATSRPSDLGWLAVIVILTTNGLGDAAVVRRWKRKADGGMGIVATYFKRLQQRRILLVHLVSAAVTTVLAVVTVLTT
ncbi:MAG TPA: hypothetical protein VM093_06100 [Aeromicrobium sp.]|nr:hypothetical protein [Aeromicrobium sp.]